MIFKFLLILIYSTSLFAAPRELEVWFLSAHKKAELQRLINQPTFVMRALTAQMECQQMGDYCFDPQFGLYKKDDLGAEVDASKVETTKVPEIPAAKSIDRDLIDCDPKNYFDMFCGKAAKKTAQAPAKLDLWIDTSSSMREMDFSDKEGGCFRKSMVKRLDETCGFNQKVNVMMFDTSIKQAGSMDSVCNNQGLNDFKRLIDWIERSDAKKLVIITDIYEFHKEFADYIKAKHGTFKGDKDPITGPDLMNMVGQLSAACR